MKMKVLLDMDGVIANFYASFASYLNKVYGTRLNIEKEPPDYGFHLWNTGLSEEQIENAVEGWMLSGGYFNIPIYNEAQNFVYRLMDLYDVYITTARIGDWSQKFPKEILERVMEDTKKWLKKYGIPADQLFFRHDKIGFCKENDILVLIEDKLSTALKGSNNGIYSILMDRGWNRKGRDKDVNKLLYVANTYDEILSLLENINERAI